ncbi:hypothetical protein PQU92_09415 [Asticcacaulis sp. BYS171W]|uniref:Terminase small subunit n=1 Tax=Asticcacaulis aquaticus TaxID=2984212 RepID=A0ABT5HTU5_9CAUL|nr:hypothetical protein [Asticcacaulis aquaticus]MDC7683493.1 hypothetical protein [Asticcacaulis aquaticus]
MSQDPRTSERLTPEERRARLRAFADRILMCVEQMDDPKDMVEAERAMRFGALVERVYSRCDAADVLRDKQAAVKIVHRVELANKTEWQQSLINKGKLPAPPLPAVAVPVASPVARVVALQVAPKLETKRAPASVVVPVATVDGGKDPWRHVLDRLKTELRYRPDIDEDGELSRELDDLADDYADDPYPDDPWYDEDGKPMADPRRKPGPSG